eukprot:CAMPEP_0194037978 /NCGR_PEP_ID=MMETSP0009_2-20130614/10268_1 /TAXON_ID=210454 /ORGANISM="Grammatophora oceanica, Strain CCMP 410" /LENGTH=569 /DNA_ID=CAMNT_0038680331 /DNA_START=159 /DNA_END=1868 /DNA_ORIENTATION=-
MSLLEQAVGAVGNRLLQSVNESSSLSIEDIGSDVNIYDFCTNQQETTPQLQCIADLLQGGQEANSADINTWLTIYASALIFFMQAGFAMLCAGSVRLKNVGNTMLKNLLDACGAALGFFLLGYGLAFGETESEGFTFVGTSNFLMIGIEDDSKANWVFQFAFAATSATIVAGTLAERCQMAAYLCYSIFLTIFVYPVVAHSAWSSNGFLSAFAKDPFLDSGMIDFAGSGVVHLTGGTTAIFATMILGPRKGRFYDARGNPLPKPKPFPGHSVALQMLGTFILWFGWYGFNPGSALTLGVDNAGSIAAVAAVNTTLSAASAAVIALFTNLFIEERMTWEAKFDLMMLMNGVLSGLVAITSGCAVMEPYGAVLTGVVAGWLYLTATSFLIKIRIDDAVDAIPVHFVNGMWGLISTGLFAQPDKVQAVYGRSEHVGWFYSWGRGSADATLLACQLCGILFIIGWVFFLMFPFFIWLNYMGWFRADSLEELVGLDISYHGGGGLGGGDEVKLEYVEAFNRRKDRKKSEHLGANGDGGPSRGHHDVDAATDAYSDEYGQSNTGGGGMGGGMGVP